MTRLITLDFETYYDKDYSLKKLTTEAYIRDPRFEVIGFAYKINDGPTTWVTENITATLKSLDLDNSRVIAHNAAFDCAILAWRYGIHPEFIFDTLSMARPVTGQTVGGSLEKLAKQFMLGEKGNEVVNALAKRQSDFSPAELDRYGEYCINDVELTYNLFHVLGQFSTPQEMYLIDLMIRMFTDPVVELDVDKLTHHLEQVRDTKAKLMERIDAAIGREQIMSNPQFAALLEKLNVAPPMKTSLRTGKETYAFSKTDPEFKELLEHPDPRVQALVAARFGVKSTLEETRTESFIQIAERGKLPIMLNYYGAHTGRASGGDKVNLQNLPRGGALRHAMRAPEGYSLIACDSAQIEARVVAWLAGEDELVNDFANHVDIYSKFATSVYGYEVQKATHKIERHVGKTCILGLGYGMGKDKFKLTLKSGNPSVDIERSEAERIVQLYRNTYPMINALWRDADAALLAMTKGQRYELGVGAKLICDGDGIHLPNGMLIRYPNLRREAKNYAYDARFGVTSIFGAKLIENVVQALARIVVFNQMAKIDQHLRKLDQRQGERYRVALTVHDEVVCVVPDHAANEIKGLMLNVMSQPPSWAAGLPVSCEADIGKTYGDCK